MARQPLTEEIANLIEKDGYVYSQTLFTEKALSSDPPKEYVVAAVSELLSEGYKRYYFHRYPLVSAIFKPGTTFREAMDMVK